MKNLHLILLFLMTISASLTAQSWQKARVSEDYTISTEQITPPLSLEERDGAGYNQISGFPVGGRANPNFKNFRNVTLVDLNGDQKDDILLGFDNRLRAYTDEGLLWEKTLSGFIIYPPSVADINDDGELDIVQTTGSINGTGRIYLLDKDGNTRSGWPLNFDGNWILTAAALADLDGDNEMEIIFAERRSPSGRIHAVNYDGSSFGGNWPVTLDATPAVTPSVGDVDGDNAVEVVVNSTESRYVIQANGQLESGFPIKTHPERRYSFQSPILADLNDDQALEIIGATHGDNVGGKPEFYVMEGDGSNYPGWPKAIAEDSWTFNTPTVLPMDGDFQIFMSRPIGDDENKDMLFAWDGGGTALNGFPIRKNGGLEGLITVADVDNDDAFELVFGSNTIDAEGNGFIHAYEMDGQTEVPNFPIRPRGWTFMNGANFGDVNGDGKMDLVALTYTQTFGAGVDSVFLNVYDLNVPIAVEDVLWGTYKGSNSRDGRLPEMVVLNTAELSKEKLEWKVVPNPMQDVGMIQLVIEQSTYSRVSLLDVNGKKIRTVFEGPLNKGEHQMPIDTRSLPTGIYLLSWESNAGRSVRKMIVNR
ncbi:MAG: T9SS type A sorting domain-containing protein [Saprospiraceae bacterium]|nr:T9SS type A sorting domain-containing protein [Saprospiraceae bacterium]